MCFVCGRDEEVNVKYRVEKRNGKTGGCAVGHVKEEAKKWKLSRTILSEMNMRALITNKLYLDRI